MIPLFPAHGALGGWDEAIFFAVVVVFLVMMAISWLRGQSMTDEPVTDEEALSETTDENRFELK